MKVSTCLKVCGCLINRDHNKFIFIKVEEKMITISNVVCLRISAAL